MGWYKDISAILEQESETWLAYLYGQQLENLPHLTKKQPRYRSVIVQVARFLLHMLRHFSFVQFISVEKPITFFFYAGSENQKSSLDKAIESLRSQGESVVAVAPSRLIAGTSNNLCYLPLRYNVSDVFRALVLLARKGPALYIELKAHHSPATLWYFGNFCSVYIYLSYFRRVLMNLEASYVVVSNDHNIYTRCLLAMAHNLKIKTAYLQHASVTTIFPALRVNYAFLDGQSALDTYKKCEPNQPKKQRNVPLPKVLLTGQKKHLVRENEKKTSAIGVALNALDDCEEAIRLVRSITEEGVEVRLRWHPGHGRDQIKKYIGAFRDCHEVAISDPRKELISEFFGNIRYLIAGNSSIHLEAALAGVKPIYYELTKPQVSDYYGYVMNGVAVQARSLTDLLKILKGGEKGIHINSEAVRYYSATYMTSWEGREGELVADCLINISRGLKPAVEESDVYNKFIVN